MKRPSEEQPEFEKPSRVYTKDTDKAIVAEVRRGGDPYKIARYFDVDIRTVLRIQRRQQIINEIFKRKRK